MQALFQDLKAVFKSFHLWPKRILKIGMPIAMSFLFIAAAFYITAEFSEAYYRALRLAEEFFICGRDFLSITLVYALTFEILQKKLNLEEQKYTD